MPRGSPIPALSCTTCSGLSNVARGRDWPNFDVTPEKLLGFVTKVVKGSGNLMGGSGLRLPMEQPASPAATPAAEETPAAAEAPAAEAPAEAPKTWAPEALKQTKEQKEELAADAEIAKLKAELKALRGDSPLPPSDYGTTQV